MLPLFSSERCKLNCNSVKVGIPSGKTWKNHPENPEHNFVDFEKCRDMSIYLHKSASIQKRTSPDKFVVRLEFASPDLESFLS